MGAELTARLFAAIRICVAALIVNALIPFFKKGIINLFTFIIFICCLVIYFFFKISPAVLVILSALAAIIQKIILQRQAQ